MPVSACGNEPQEHQFVTGVSHAMTAQLPNVAKPAREKHFINRIGWLRAVVLGANDGVLSMIGSRAAAHSADRKRRTAV